jgi:hypothetical protein
MQGIVMIMLAIVMLMLAIVMIMLAIKDQVQVSLRIGTRLGLRTDSLSLSRSP